MGSLRLAALAAVLAGLFPSIVEAQGTFDRSWAVSAYATGWHGRYAGIGGGGKLRVEPFAHLGIEVFAEVLVVDSPESRRLDIPTGFNLYVPVALGSRVRLRPLLGFCTVVSMIDPDPQFAEKAQDVLFGFHAGIGVEVAVLPRLSFFTDLKAIAYLGHEPYAGRWPSGIGGDLTVWPQAQLLLGWQLHI